MLRVLRRVTVLAVAMWLATASALGHGASRGLHLHLSPTLAERGATVEVEVHASEPLASLGIAFVGEKRVVVRREPPDHRIAVHLIVPFGARSGTLSLHAEGRTARGRTVRAAAILRVADPPPERDPAAEDGESAPAPAPR